MSRTSAFASSFQMPASVKLCLIVAVLFLNTYSNSIAQPLSNYFIEVFDNKDGLPSIKSSELFRDSRGFLWVGGDKGLFVYNGIRFTAFPFTSSSNNPLNLFVISINEDINNRLWLSTKNGLKIIDLATNEVKEVFLNSSLCSIPDTEIVDISSNDKDGMYVLTRNNLFLVSLNFDIKEVFDCSLLPLFRQANGDYVNSNQTTVFRYCCEGENKRIYPIPFSSEIPTIPLFFEDLKRKHSLNISTKAIEAYIKTEFPSFNVNKIASCIYEDYTNRSIMATVDGVFTFSSKNKINDLTSLEQLKGKSLRMLYEDESGDIFIGTYDGFYRWNPDLNQLDLLEKNTPISDYLKLGRDSLLLIADPGYLFLFNPLNNQLKEIELKVEANIGRIPTFLLLHKNLDNTILLGSANFQLPDSIKLIRDCHNNPVLFDRLVNNIHKEENGTKWLGTDKGLYKVQGCHITNIALKGNIVLSQVNTIVEYSKDTLLLGTLDHGVILFDTNTHFYDQVNMMNGLSDNRIASILPISKKKYWIATYNGLNYVDFENDEIISLNQKDGLPFNEFNRFSARQLKNGDFLFGGVDGLVKVSKDISLDELSTVNLGRILSFSKINPHTGNFEYFYIDKKNQTITLEPNEKHINFFFGSQDLLKDKIETYSYKLEGINSEWIDGDATQKTSYSNLKEGQYTFKVRQKNNKGLWVNIPHTINLRVETYFYQKTWFKLILGAFFIAIIGSIYSYRQRQKKRIYQIKENISNNLHDHVGTTLSVIQRTIKNIKHKDIQNEELQKELSKIEKIGKNAVQEMSDAIWSINPEFATLHHLINRMADYADDVLTGLNIPYHITTQNLLEKSALDANTKYTLYLIYKEAINNALEHTVANEINILFERKSDVFIMQISNTYSALKPKPSNLHNGIGLKSMRKRATSIGATIEFEHSNQEFIVTFTQ